MTRQPFFLLAVGIAVVAVLSHTLASVPQRPGTVRQTGRAAAPPANAAVVQPIAPFANPQVASVAEAFRTGAHPERISTFFAPTPFDARAFAEDPEDYLSVVEPGRVFDTAQPGEGVLALRPTGNLFHHMAPGGSLALSVRAVPLAPVSFTSFDLGAFENQLPFTTVRADEDGVATANFHATPGTVADVDIVAGSPLLSGQVHFQIVVRHDPPAQQATREENLTRLEEPRGSVITGTVNLLEARQIVRDTAFPDCRNPGTPWCCCHYPAAFRTADCDAHSLDFDLHSSPGSVVDPVTMSYHHTASDYEADPNAASGCTGCAAPSSGGGKDLPSLCLERVHRYRDQAVPSNFGPGVFSSWDTKIFLFETDDEELLIDVFDPLVLVPQRFADGEYEDPRTLLTISNPRDGIYESLFNKAKEIRLLDSDEVLTAEQDEAVTAILRTHSGLKFHFELFESGGGLVGRLTRMENRNAYGVSISYKFDSGDGLDRQWQIDRITDAHGREALFDYHAEQQAGRWAVSEIQFPNQESADYSYSDGFLSSASHADGTESTITKSFDTVSQTTVLDIFDAAAEATSRAKSIYLSDCVMPTVGTLEIIPQSAALVRIVANGDDEVTFLSIPGPTAEFQVIYEGTGKLKQIHFDAAAELRPRYFKTWALVSEGDGTWTNDAGTGELEDTSSSYIWPSPFLEYRNAFYKLEPISIHDRTGRSVDYEYNAQSAVALAVHPDGSAERFQYNEFRQVTQQIDRLDRVTQYTYDDRGNMLSKTAGLLFVGGEVIPTEALATWRWQYFPEGHPNQYLLSKSIDANGNETDYLYDANSFLTTVIEPPDEPGGDRAQRHYHFDSAGRMERSIDAVGRVVAYIYDERSRVIEIQYADNSSDSFTYGIGSSANLVVERFDRNGNVWTMEYDSSGRMTVETEAVNDPDITVDRECSFVDGTSLLEECTYKGETTRYAYDYRQRVIATTVQPRVGTELITTNKYDRNLLIRTTDPYGRSTFHGYDTIDQYLLRTVREMKAGHFPETFGEGDQLDLFGLLREFVDNARFVIEDRVMDEEGQLLTRTDGRRIEHTHQYDSQGRMTEQVIAASTPAVSARTRYNYDPEGNLVRQFNPRHFAELEDFATESAYTGRNLLKTRTEAVGRPEQATVSHKYNLDRTIDVTTDYRGNDWKTVFQPCCRRVQARRDPTGSGTISNLDHYGNLTHTAVVQDLDAVANLHDPVGVINEVTTRVDGRHRPVARTVWLVDLGDVDPNDVPIAGEGGIPEDDGLTTRLEYDDDLTDGNGIDSTYASYLDVLNLGPGSVGYGVVITNPQDEKTATIHDGVGRVVLVIDGNGNATRVDYDAVVNVNAFGGGTDTGDVLETLVVDALEHATRTRTDGGDRTLQIVDEEDQITKYDYDNSSNRVRTRDPNALGLECVFDDRNRDVSCTDTEGDSTSKAFDAESNVTAYIDGFGKRTTCVYDARNRRHSVTSRVGGVTLYTYDGNNNVLSIEDADGGLKECSYDERNLKESDTFADGGVIRYGYDGALRLINRLDQRNDLTEFEYDRANRLTERLYPDDLDDVFTYDRASRLVTAASNRYANTITRAYDDASRLTSEELTTQGQDYAVSYGYDEDDRKTQITYPDESRVRRTYTDRDQLADVAFNDEPVVVYGYDIGMRLISTEYGNGRAETRSYFDDNHVRSIDVPGITAFSYEYDANKRREFEGNAIEPSLHQTYGYDDEDRLCAWERADSMSQTWDLTEVGDWDGTIIGGVSQDRDHNLVHELIQVDDTEITYDAKGNLTQNLDGQTHVWDFDNQLMQATVEGDTTQYTYDALGRRIAKTTPGGWTIFVYDRMQVIAEYEGGLIARRYVYGSYIDDACALVDTSTYYYHRDSLYNTRAITDQDGALVETYSYAPYGQVDITDAEGHRLLESAIHNPYMFQARRRDQETQLHYFRARYVDTTLGRYLSRDPAGIWFDAGSLGNGYGFCAGDPVNHLDPMGFQEAAAQPDEVYNDETVKKAMKKAWADSLPRQTIKYENVPGKVTGRENVGAIADIKGEEHEEGGWIVRKACGELKVIRWPPGITAARHEPVHKAWETKKAKYDEAKRAWDESKQGAYGGPAPGDEPFPGISPKPKIEEDIESGRRYVKQNGTEYEVVASFHTHPFRDSLTHPSKGDLAAAKVPGYVIGHAGIVKYDEGTQHIPKPSAQWSTTLHNLEPKADRDARERAAKASVNEWLRDWQSRGDSPWVSGPISGCSGRSRSEVESCSSDKE